MLYHEDWREYLHGLAASFPSAAVVAAPVDPRDPAGADFDELSALVFEVRIDHRHREITLHTEPDEDGAPFPLLPLTIKGLVDQLALASNPEFSMLWVSGQARVPGDGATAPGNERPSRTYFVRQDGPIGGVAVSEVDHRVVFLYFANREPESFEPRPPPGAPADPL